MVAIVVPPSSTTNPKSLTNVLAIFSIKLPFNPLNDIIDYSKSNIIDINFSTIFLTNY